VSYDLVDLKLVAAIADCGSLSGAATRLRLATSSASSRLTNLESSLQVQLFDRRARGLSPTTAGATAIRHARQVLARLGQLEMDLAPFANNQFASVTLMANSSAINSFLPEALAKLRHQHPALGLCIEERPSSEIASSLLSGEADIGVAALGAVPSGIEAIRFRSERLVLIVPSGHPQAATKNGAFADLVAGQAFVCLRAGSDLHRFMTNVAAASGVQLDVRVQMESHHAVCRMVAAGMGVGVVPLGVAQLEMEGGEAPLVAIPLAESWAERTLYLCWRQGQAKAGSVAAIVEHLGQWAHF
jgi:DNA-binding transcriptional LysR family regulator